MIDTITTTITLIEKHGLGLLMNAIFIVYIVHSIRTNDKNTLNLINKITDLIIVVDEKIVKGQLQDELIKVMVKNKWREFLKDYNKEIYLYLLKNNIAINYSIIDSELLNLITKQVYSLRVLLQDKTTLNNVNKLCDLLKQELTDTHNIIMEIFKELATTRDYENDKKTTVRSLEIHFDKILDKGLTDIDNLDI